MACSICNNAVAFSSEPSAESIKLSDIEKSAKTCKYCQIILSIFDDIDPTSIDYMRINEDDWDGSRKGINLHISASKEDCSNACPPGVTNTGSAISVNWAKEKIKECQESHESCNLQKQGVLPDRVLSIGRTDSITSDEDEDWLKSDVALFETHGEESAYATLSHRWGTQQPIRLLTTNISEFRQNISWSALPKTFQDAIFFARKLNIPYIWIDSLCIIQDSKEDWLVQSGKMAGIYEHSTITVAATTAEDGRAGCFVEPSPFLQGCVTDGKVKMPVEGNEEEVRKLVASADADSPVVYIKQDTEHHFPGYFTNDELPLLKRGWVYQERLLSPRIVHFGMIDLIWECNSDTACYCKYYTPSYSRNPISHPVKPQHIVCLRPNPGSDGMAYRWVRLVEEYTAMDLTFASDRLPAIAGVAKQFRRGLENKNYLAGLWEDSLLTGLTWSRSCPREQKKRPAEPSPGPSWSWLSVAGPILFPQSRYIGQSPSSPPKLERIEFDQGDDREFMTLWGGSITLHGKLVEVKQRIIETTEGPRFIVFAPGVQGYCETNLDYEPDEDEIQRGWKTVYPKWSQQKAPKASDGMAHAKELPESENLEKELPLYLDEEKYAGTKQSDKKVYCFWMGLRLDDGSRQAIFLVLDCKDEAEQTYTRLGLGLCSPEEALFRGENASPYEVPVLANTQSITIV